MMAQRVIERAMTGACLILAAFFILSFTYIAIASITYPFPLEWMEGQSIDIIQRIRDGQELYVAPSLDYVPLIYTPLYYYASAFASLFFGVDFFAGRVVSLLAALGCGVILYRWVRHEGGQRAHAVIASGLFFATYPLSARWFDIARIDSLFLLLALAALYIVYFHRTPLASGLAALLFTAAFFTKQSALMIAAPAFAAMLFIDRKHALLTGATFGALLLAGIVAANFISGGWFNFYVFDVPAGHGIDGRKWVGFWRNDLVKPLWPALIIACVTLACLHKKREKIIWYVAVALGLAGTAYASRLHSYGWTNVLMPAHAAIALLAGLALAQIARPWWRSAALVMAAAQMALLVYNPVRLIPSQLARERGERFLEQVAAIEGDVFIPELQWVQRRVGKTSYGLGMAAFDVLRADLGENNAVKEQLRNDIRKAIQSRRFAAILPGRLLRLPEMANGYRHQGRTENSLGYATGGINILRTDIFVPIDNEDGNIKP